MKNIKHQTSNYFFVFLFSLVAHTSFTQVKEPDHIKSIQLKPLGQNNFSIIIPFGRTIQLDFDDLEGDQKDYYYKIEMMNHDWTPSRLLSNQYINGFQSDLIRDVENSFNTFQNYTHYSVRFPNQNTSITKSGNYQVSVLDETDEIIFTRRFTYYESSAVVGVSVSRGRNAAYTNEQQTVNFTVNHQNIRLNNPNQEIHVVVLKNQNWKTSLTGIQPQFYKPNQLIYRYINKTNFWGGNEYLFFDNKIIRNTSINVARVERKDLFHNYLYPYKNRAVKNYSFNPDINGQFIPRTLEGNDASSEADYAFVHFTLQVEDALSEDVYVYGAFNNFELSDKNKMQFNELNKTYNATLLLKQGFYNYTYVTESYDGKISEAELRGNFSKTENEYTVVVYYKPLGGLFDRVIGVGSIIFQGER